MSNETYQSLPLLLDAATATGIGLLIGLEREQHESSERPHDANEASAPDLLLGVRTFGLLALFGWVIAYAGVEHPWLPVVGLIPASALVFIAALRTNGTQRGLTTEVAALITVVLGMIVHHQRSVAVAMGLLTALLLISKPFFREFVPRMRRVDLTATLQLLILLAIVLPLLPEEARDPWGVLSPRRLGMFVALVAGIGYVGYVLHRVLGPRRSAALTGLVGGLVSSTAVTVAMGQQVRATPSLARPGQLATLLASTVMFVRVVIVASLLDKRMVSSLAIPFTAMAACTLLGALWTRRQMIAEAREPAASRTVELVNPFSLLPALQWGALVAVILVLSAVARQSFGDSGFIATAALSGLIDVDAMTVIATRSASTGEIDIALASLAVTVAVASNTVVKSVVALVVGGWRYGLVVAGVFALSMLVGVLAAALAL
ncbi:MAG TPA: MgtC/SapB family protein [Polyangiales bacterium]